MKMIKGYQVPSPNSADGDYGGFASYASYADHCYGGNCGSGYGASPTGTPYWSMGGEPLPQPGLNGLYITENLSGIDSPVPALSGYGATPEQVPTESGEVFKLLLAGVAVRWIQKRYGAGAAIGAAVAYAFVLKNFRLPVATPPTVAGYGAFGMMKRDEATEAGAGTAGSLTRAGGTTSAESGTTTGRSFATKFKKEAAREAAFQTRIAAAQIASGRIAPRVAAGFRAAQVESGLLPTTRVAGGDTVPSGLNVGRLPRPAGTGGPVDMGTSSTVPSTGLVGNQPSGERVMADQFGPPSRGLPSGNGPKLTNDVGIKTGGANPYTGGGGGSTGSTEPEADAAPELKTGPVSPAAPAKGGGGGLLAAAAAAAYFLVNR